MKKGQVLLITVMLLATIMTVLLSVTFQSTTETQATKLEEESQKSLAAAEAAIEASLKSGASTNLASLSSFGASGFTGQALVESTATNTFTSPLIAQDGAYTFYLGKYVNKVIGNSTYQDVKVCFGADSAIEVTLLKNSASAVNPVKKYILDPTTHNIPSVNNTNSCGSDFPNSLTVLASDIGTDGQILFVRVLFASTRLLFSASGDLSPQGNTITSQAKSASGVTKKVVLFQSYPQIPAEFFATSF